MSEGIKRYIMITSTILLVLICVGCCWMFNFSWQIVFIFSYLFGFFNGMMILGIYNCDD